ncbi:hypothetical protein PT974_07824 [Cladobotryum mycophilum]|uniref:Uncharacterized protein n=1 Tax=Cladobotryum mycophilum TaxID=491253 RepID=A0ABR0SJ58_9HYPO
MAPEDTSSGLDQGRSSQITGRAALAGVFGREFNLDNGRMGESYKHKNLLKTRYKFEGEGCAKANAAEKRLGGAGAGAINGLASQDRHMEGH